MACERVGMRRCAWMSSARSHGHGYGYGYIIGSKKTDADDDERDLLPARKTFATVKSRESLSGLTQFARKREQEEGTGGGGEAGGFQVIARVVNDYNTPVYIDWRTVTSRIRVDPEWVEGLDKIDGYSHLLIVWLMDQVHQKKKSHVPQGLYNDVPKVGIFSCRCPQRPNPIALTLCKLVRVEGDMLVVEGLDAINSSPVLDIKPYTPEFDDVAIVRPGEIVTAPGWNAKLTY